MSQSLQTENRSNVPNYLTTHMLSEMGQTPALRDLACSLADEFRNWAQSEGYTLPSNTWLVDLMIDAGAFPTSMLQDAMAGKPLELDAICLAPMELAKRKGASMPTLHWLLDRLTMAETLPVEKSRLPELLRTLHLSQTA